MQENGFDRFDLEGAITEFYNTSDDIKLLAEEVANCEEFDRERIVNALIGIEELTRLRYNKVFRIFETMIEENKFNDEPCP